MTAAMEIQILIFDTRTSTILLQILYTGYATISAVRLRIEGCTGEDGKRRKAEIVSTCKQTNLGQQYTSGKSGWITEDREPKKNSSIMG